MYVCTYVHIPRLGRKLAGFTWVSPAGSRSFVLQPLPLWRNEDSCFQKESSSLGVYLCILYVHVCVCIEHVHMYVCTCIVDSLGVTLRRVIISEVYTYVRSVMNSVMSRASGRVGTILSREFVLLQQVLLCTYTALLAVLQCESGDCHVVRPAAFRPSASSLSAGHVGRDEERER